MTVTLNRLRTFVILAQTSSFQKTSEIVGRSQPAVSSQIRSLEEALGVPLFYRKTRNVMLTQMGELIFTRVGRLLEELDDMLDDLHDVASLETGEVRVGATPTLAGYILPKIIQSFRQKHPGIRVHFTDEPTMTLERLVIDRKLDFYFGPEPSVISGLEFSSVAQDEYVVVTPEKHKLLDEKKVLLKMLEQYPFLSMRSGTKVRREVDNFFARCNLQIEPIEEVSSHFTLGGLVAAECGITLLPYSALSLVGHPGVSFVKISDAMLHRTLGIATRRDYRPAPAATAFMNMMVPLVKKEYVKHRREADNNNPPHDKAPI